MPTAPLPAPAADPATDDAASPARGPRWARRKERRPAELMAAALDLFVERGFAATRLDDVASRAGVSKGTLYLYYASKEELFKAVVRENVVPLIDEYRRDAAASEDPSAVLLARFFHDWWSQFGATKLSGLCKLMVAEAGNFPELARFFHDEVIEPNGAVLASLIERGIRRGEFRPIDVECAVHHWMAPMVLKAIWQVSMAPCCPPQAWIDPDRFVAFHTDGILRTLAFPPPPDGAPR